MGVIRADEGGERDAGGGAQRGAEECLPLIVRSAAGATDRSVAKLIRILICGTVWRVENDAQDFAVELFVTAEGRSPFLSWLNSITDLYTSARILVALDELKEGALKASRSIGGGVYEHVAKIPGSAIAHFIYFAIVGRDTLLVVGGGSAPSQKEDSARAFDLWKEFKAHAH